MTRSRMEDEGSSGERGDQQDSPAAFSIRLQSLLEECGLSTRPESVVDWNPTQWGRILVRISEISEGGLRHILTRELTEASLKHAGRGMQLSGLSLGKLKLSNMDLRRCRITRADLSGTDFSGSNLEGATIICPLGERLTLKGTNLRGMYGHALAAQNADFSGVDMSNAQDMTGSLFHGVNLRGASLRGANLSGSLFYQCDLSGADFDEAGLVATAFTECTMVGTRFRNACIDTATITKCNGEKLDLRRAQGEGVVLQSVANLADANFADARLAGMTIRNCRILAGIFDGADLSEISISSCSLSRSSFVGARMSRVRLSGVNGESNDFSLAVMTAGSIVGSSLHRSSFRGVKGENLHVVESVMRECVFSDYRGTVDSSTPFMGRCFTVRDSDLSHSNFENAYLYRASMTGDPIPGMGLSSCNFDGANLIQAYIAADLSRSSMRELKGAYLRLNQADLSEVDLTSADLFQASMVKTVVRNCNLTGVEAPFFADRLKGTDTATLDENALGWLEDLSGVQQSRRRGST